MKNLSGLTAATGIHADTFKEALGLVVETPPASPETQVAKEKYDATFTNGADRETKLVAWWEFEALSLADIEKASTISEVMGTQKNIPGNHNVQKAAALRLNSFLITLSAKTSDFDDLRELWHRSSNGSTAESAILLKLIELSETVAEIREVFFCAKGIPTTEDTAIEKWISLCSSIEEICELRFHCRPGSNLQKAMFEKWEKFALTKIEKASTIEEVRKAYLKAAHNREARHIALVKMHEIYQRD